jgi:hypothetical protein
MNEKKPHPLSKEGRALREAGNAIGVQEEQANLSDLANEETNEIVVKKEKIAIETNSETEEKVTLTLSQLKELVDSSVEQQLSKKLAKPDKTIATPTYPGIFQKPDLTVGLPVIEEKDRYYVYSGGETGVKPNSVSIRHKNRQNSVLQWKNPATGTLHSLRFCSNQPSFLQDQQVGDVTLQKIEMTDGMLFVPKENHKLNLFLHVHPDLNRVFKELDKEKDAQKELEDFELEGKALYLATNTNFNVIEAIARVVLSNYNEGMGSGEIKRDVANWAKANPQKFIDYTKDDLLQVKGIVKTALTRNLITFENQSRKFINAETGKIIYVSAWAEDETVGLANFFVTNQEGRDLYDYLKYKIG